MRYLHSQVNEWAVISSMDSSANEESTFGLPDQGELLVILARTVAGEAGAEAVAAEIQRVRRSDGALTLNDLTEYRKPKDGPLYALSTLLWKEAMVVSVWAERGFGFFQRKKAGRTVDDLAKCEGVASAVAWALSNSTGKLHTSVLRDMLGNLLQKEDDFNLVANMLQRSLHKWR